MFKKLLVITLVAVVGLSFTSCKNREKNLGSEENPFIISFMPSAEKAVMEKQSTVIASKLSKASGLNFKASLAPNYITIIDGLGSKKIDVAFINSLGYLLAREWCGAEAKLQLVGIDGKMFYQSAIIAGADSGIKTLDDISGKSFAYTDPYSMAGYLLPLDLFTDKHISPSSTSFVEGYSEVVDLVYNGKMAAGAVYYHKPDPYGRINDARAKLVSKYNDMLEKVHIITTTGEIPNPPVVFRKELKPEVAKKLNDALLKLSEDPEILAALEAMYDARAFAPVDNKSFDQITETLKKLGKEVKEVVPGGVTFFQKHIWEHVPEF